MKTIKLTYNQELKLFWGETIRVKRNGVVMYISDEGGELVPRTWLGTVWEEFKISSEMFDRQKEFDDAYKVEYELGNSEYDIERAKQWDDLL